MRRTTASLTVFALTLTAAALLVWIPSWHVQADDDQDGGVVGTWILDATLAPGFTERELIAITPGGTFTITSAVFNAHSSENPFLPPFFMVDLSDGYGAWKRQGDSNRFSVTFKRHLFAGPKIPSSLYGTFFLGQNVGEGTVQSPFSSMAKTGTRCRDRSPFNLGTFAEKSRAPAAERFLPSVSKSSPWQRLENNLRLAGLGRVKAQRHRARRY